MLFMSIVVGLYFTAVACIVHAIKFEQKDEE